jgi:hypothetical protein
MHAPNNKNLINSCLKLEKVLLYSAVNNCITKSYKIKIIIPTCIFPMRNENSTKPEIEMKTAKQISQT